MKSTAFALALSFFAASTLRGEALEPSPKTLAGTWCLDALAMNEDGERMPDGTMWTFGEDGSFAFLGGITQKGRYRFEEGRLLIDDVGSHEVVSLSEEEMVLYRISYHFFLRDHCSEETQAAQRITRFVNAAGRGNLEMVKRLLEKGIDIDARDLASVFESTALASAARFGRAEVVAYLLDQGADPTIENALERAPLELAERAGHEAVVALLRGAMTKDSEPE